MTHPHGKLVTVIPLSLSFPLSPRKTLSFNLGATLTACSKTIQSCAHFLSPPPYQFLSMVLHSLASPTAISPSQFPATIALWGYPFAITHCSLPFVITHHSHPSPHCDCTLQSPPVIALRRCPFIIALCGCASWLAALPCGCCSVIGHCTRSPWGNLGPPTLQG
jgi:hypothetical protein